MQKTKTDSFIKAYHRKGIEDWGAYNSEDMKSFGRKFKNYLKRALPGWEVVKYSTGHYFVSTFLKKDGTYVYLSYSVPRGGYAMDFNSKSCMFGVLIRIALDDTDYSGKGGPNNYTSVMDIGFDVNLLAERYGKRK